MDKSLHDPSKPSLSIPFECCPLCEAFDARPVVEADCTRHSLYHKDLPGTLVWLECIACSHVYTSERWSPEALALIFSKTHDHQKPGHDMESARLVSAEIIEKVIAQSNRPFPAKTDRWLDVGFGNGGLLFTALEYGFDVCGIDLRADSVAAMQSVGVKADCVSLEAFQNDGRAFAVISMADCLEHMPFPKQALRAAHKLILPGGFLFLSMPNMGAPLWGMMDATRSNPYWGEIEHYHNFTRDRLEALLKETGFSPVSYGVSKRYRCGMEIIAVAV